MHAAAVVHCGAAACASWLTVRPRCPRGFWGPAFSVWGSRYPQQTQRNRSRSSYLRPKSQTGRMTFHATSSASTFKAHVARGSAMHLLRGLVANPDIIHQVAVPWPGKVLREEVGIVLLRLDALHLDLAVAQLVLEPKITYGEMFHPAYSPPGHHRPNGRGVTVDSQTRRLPELVQD
eukprot:12999389-Heterocapsa_arctica.AAC.1